MSIEAVELTDIRVEITNFLNPHSSITVTSLRVSSYRSRDCSGDAESSTSMNEANFFPLYTPEENFAMSASSNVLGDSDPANTITFKFTPVYSTSPDARGLIGINLPSWYNVQGKLNMMYNEQARNKCTSDDMEITSSEPGLINRNLMIAYKNMKPDKIKGGELTIVCQGFKNPIYQKKWPGFVISVYDSERIPNVISTTDFLSFDATTFEPAIIPRNGLTITPTIFKIAESSMWVLSISNFPIPLETQCYVKLTVPADLAVTLTTVEGSQMFSPTSGNIVQGIDKVDNADGSTTIKFQSCFRDRSVGPSPQGRLEINRIKTPLARRDTGKFQFELYKDYAYESRIAVLSDGIYVPASDLAPGAVLVMQARPAGGEDGVQIVTDYNVHFITEHTLYPPATIKIEFPPAIILPPTDTVVVIKPLHPDSKDYIKATTGVVTSGNIIKIEEVFGGE